MRSLMLRALALAAVLAMLAVAPAAVTVPQSQIAAENARWKSFGVQLPPGGIVLAHPYASPYSNRSFVVPWSWYERYYTYFRAHHDYPVKAPALRADLPVLQLLMEKAYAGYPAAESRGWSWSAWFAAWSRSLAARGNATLTIAQAFAPWGKLEKFQLDNHSGVAGYQGFVSGSVSAVLASRPGGSCSALRTSRGSFSLASDDAGQQPHAVQRWSGHAFSPAWYVSYPERDGAARSIRCGARTIGLTPAAASQPAGDTPTYQSLGDGIAYVRMPTFNDANDAALRSILAGAKGIGKERAVVIDLRGNQGGNAPTDVLTNWAALSAIENASALKQYRTDSCFTHALSFGLQQQLVHGIKAPVDASTRQFLQQIVDTLKGPSNCSPAPSQSNSQQTLAEHQFSLAGSAADQPRLIAIVNNTCGSDCEYMASVIAGIPGSVLAGTSTYGVMGFTQPGYFVLPNSRVPFRLALSRTDAYGDGRSVDGYGISVDVLLPTAASQSRSSLEALAKALAPPGVS
jgi:hypothetical protein